MLSKEFLTDAGIRVLRTFAQALIGALGLDGAGVIHASLTQALAVAFSAAVLSALTQLAAVTGSQPQDKGAEAPVKTKSEAPGPVINPNG